MPQSKKTSLTEIDARLSVEGIESVVNYYDGARPNFLIIPPANELPPPLVWTPVDGYQTPKTDLTGLEGSNLFQDIRNLPNYAIMSSVVVPLLKSERNKNHQLLVGRASDNDIRLSSADVSKRHAMLEVKVFRDANVPCQWSLTDLNSSNGTFSNGNRLDPLRNALVFPNDELCFGGIRTLFTDFQGLITLCGLARARPETEGAKDFDPQAVPQNESLQTIRIARGA